MAGGGLLILVAYGSQNVILSGNPQLTYFYKAFKRYSHFSFENITIPLEGQNELSFFNPIQLRAKIPRYGDLLSDLYLTVRVPNIFSKFLTPAAREALNDRTGQYEFQWVRYLGAALIRRAAFYVGPSKIQEFDGTYLLAKATMDFDQDKFQKWKTLIGDVAELTEPSLGSFAAGTGDLKSYPTVYQNPQAAITAQANRPSIFERELHIPLSFWFTEAFSQALPLVGIQLQDIEIQLELNPIQSLYTIFDISGNRVNPSYKLLATEQEIQQNVPTYVDYNATDTQIFNFTTDVGVTANPTTTWDLRPRLQGTFVYLPQDEQQVFATRPLTYVYNQITTYTFSDLLTRQVLDLETHNPINRILIVPRRTDWLYRNDFHNFTNWVNYPNAPFQPTPGLSPIDSQQCSGLAIPNSQQEIIRNLRILAEGTEIQELKSGEFFTRLMPYRYTTGIGADGLLLYSFQLQSSPTQPSGSINTSRVKNFQVDVDVYPVPVGAPYAYDITFYVENINWLEIVSGSGAPKYAK
jgi:hypothetical protein